MTSDDPRVELRRLAARYEDTVDDIDAHLEAVQDYRDATRPDTVLALLDDIAEQAKEIERLNEGTVCASCGDVNRRPA